MPLAKAVIVVHWRLGTTVAFAIRNCDCGSMFVAGVD